MKLPRRALLVLAIFAALAGCGPKQAAWQPQKVEGPAVAGLFYPRHEDDLGKQLDQLLDAAQTEPIEHLRALVCPHAGYEYSGPTAAAGYKQLVGRPIHTVIVLGPSHTASFQGAALPDADAMETPLGLIRISAKAADLAKRKPFAVNPPCQVQRPRWAEVAPKKLPPFGEETPHTFEHSVEVQLPFLQRTLGQFEVVPVVFGEVDPEEAAKALLEVLDDDTLLVASSDLTHYLPYAVAKSLDSTTVQAICSLNVAWFEEEEASWEARANISLACGKDPILTVMHVARLKGWKARLLDYRNSGDTAGSKQQGVVGYAAIAFYEPAEPAAEKPAAGKNQYTPAERAMLLRLARQAVVAAANGDDPPEADAKTLNENVSAPRACFVTLKKNGQLRGCIGTVFPRESLYQAVLHSARSAAVEDHRFPPVKPEELKDLDIEVSVLSLPQRLKFNSPEDLLQKLRPNVDGVVLRVGKNQGLFLPQVWEQIPDKVKFLDELASQKAGLDPSAWRRSDARVLIYQAEAFQESEK
jgi:MEMO1 family protein